MKTDEEWYAEVERLIEEGNAVSAAWMLGCERVVGGRTIDALSNILCSLSQRIKKLEENK